MDRIKIFGERLKKVQEGLQTIKAFGLDENILIAWLCHKMKISEKQARNILACEEEFFNELARKDLADKL